ncbi:hypothetical protein DsansV1_C08g0085041 [Dioscorea sansibarensis]
MVKDKKYSKFKNVQIDPDEACIDPLHKTFLENFKEDGNSYVFEMKDGDHGFPAFVKYENEYAESAKIKSESAITFKGKGIYGNDKGPASIRSCPKSIKQSCSSSDPSSQLESGKPLVDECLQTFVDHSNFGDKSKFPEYKPVMATRYEAKKENLAASTRLSKKAAHNHRHGKTYMKNYKSDDFKRKLMIVLNKPYNHNEYQMLLREAAERKPLCKMKNLRSITISYATEQSSNSYLDYYPDLAKQIESANSEKALVLLRGFFFWLKNLCHEGAYRPWSHHS